MTAVRRREVRCAKCGSWWHHPREPVHFSSWDEWAEENPETEIFVCPECGGVTEVSEKTARFTTETGTPAGTAKKKEPKGKKG